MVANKKRKSKGNFKNRPEFKSNYVVITINLPRPVIDSIDDLLGVLYASRSEAIRFYSMRCLGGDLELINQMSGDYTSMKPEVLFEEDGENYFIDKKGKTWFVGKALERVGRPIINV